MVTFDRLCTWLAALALVVAAVMAAKFSGCGDARQETPEAIREHWEMKFQKNPQGSLPRPPN